MIFFDLNTTRGIIKRFPLFFIMLAAVSCGGKGHLELSGMVAEPEDKETVNVPQDCAYIYEAKKWEVAVVEFANNTGYGDMTVKNRDSSGRGVSDTVGVAAGVGRVNREGNFTGVGAGSGHTVSSYSSNSSEFMGQFAPSLGTFAQSVTEETLSQLGGVTLINRSHLDKILQEQQFQMTIADPDSVMEFGRLSGVKYIFTGSVDNIQAKYVAPTNINGGSSDLGAIISLLSSTYDAAASGWFVSASLTLNLIDAETGKLVYSKTVTGKKKATQSPGFQADIIINAAKSIMSGAVKNVSDEIAAVFEMTGYINEIMGGKKVAHINLGSGSGIREGDVMDVYDVRVSKDFLTGETTCGFVKLDAKIIISDQISPAGSWGYIEGGKSAVRNIKIGSRVKRSAVGK